MGTTTNSPQRGAPREVLSTCPRTNDKEKREKPEVTQRQGERNLLEYCMMKFICNRGS